MWAANRSLLGAKLAFDLSIFGKRIVVTGASGFIGSNLCRRLVKEGAEIHAISRQARTTTQSNLTWWQGDLTNNESIRKILANIKPNLIFHLAGYVNGSRGIENVLPSFHNNLLSQVNLMTIACETGCERFIASGSMEEPEIGLMQAVPNSPYTAAKLASRLYSRMFSALYQFSVVMPRIFMVYGPGQSDLSKLIPYVITSLLRGNAPKLTSGKRNIDWIFIDDVVDALLILSQTPTIENNLVDIGSGKLVSIQSVVNTLVNIINPGIQPLFGAVSDRLLEKESIANVEDTYRSIGWRSKVSIEDGLRITVDWYRSYF